MIVVTSAMPHEQHTTASLSRHAPVAGLSAVTATTAGSKLNVAAKEWVPPTAAAATPAANGISANDSQQQYNNWQQYGGWTGDGGYDANGYEYGYGGWLANDATAAQWGQSGGQHRLQKQNCT